MSRNIEELLASGISLVVGRFPWHSNEHFPNMLGALCVYAIAYRYYSVFIAAKALALDDRSTTPAQLYPDGTIMLLRQSGSYSVTTLRQSPGRAR